MADALALMALALASGSGGGGGGGGGKAVFFDALSVGFMDSEMMNPQSVENLTFIDSIFTEFAVNHNPVLIGFGSKVFQVISASAYSNYSTCDRAVFCAYIGIDEAEETYDPQVRLCAFIRHPALGRTRLKYYQQMTQAELETELENINGAIDKRQAKALSESVNISVSDWSEDLTCTKTVTGVRASSIVIIDPSDPAVECTAQAAGKLTFKAKRHPTETVAVKVVIFP